MLPSSSFPSPPLPLPPASSSTVGGTTHVTESRAVSVSIRKGIEGSGTSGESKRDTSPREGGGQGFPWRGGGEGGAVRWIQTCRVVCLAGCICLFSSASASAVVDGVSISVFSFLPASVTVGGAVGNPGGFVVVVVGGGGGGGGTVPSFEWEVANDRATHHVHEDDPTCPTRGERKPTRRWRRRTPMGERAPQKRGDVMAVVKGKEGEREDDVCHHTVKADRTHEERGGEEGGGGPAVRCSSSFPFQGGRGSAFPLWHAPSRPDARRCPGGGSKDRKETAIGSRPPPPMGMAASRWVRCDHLLRGLPPHAAVSLARHHNHATASHEEEEEEGEAESGPSAPVRRWVVPTWACESKAEEEGCTAVFPPHVHSRSIRLPHPIVKQTGRRGLEGEANEA